LVTVIVKLEAASDSEGEEEEEGEF